MTSRKTATYDKNYMSNNDNFDDNNDDDNACLRGYSNTLTHSPGSVTRHWVQP